MENFTPVSATIGGILIGIAAVWLMATLGRIAGISGIVAGVASGPASERTWRTAFVLGLILPPALLTVIGRTPPAFELAAGWPWIVAGGLLVGFGTRLGSGCTSGHGVCGLSRLSPRSLVAVLVFMAAGVATVTIMRRLLGV